MRYTYGFSRKEHAISESYIVKATGISKRFVASELKKLIQYNLITVIRESTYTSPKILAFNKDFDAWRCCATGQQVKNNSTVEREVASTGEESFYSTGEDSFNQENNIKTNSKTNSADAFFESIWSLYPLKRGKAQVRASARKRLLDIGYDEIARAIERYVADLKKEEWRKPQNGATFFNSGYVDYLDRNYTYERCSPNKIPEQQTGAYYSLSELVEYPVGSGQYMPRNEVPVSV